MDRTSTRPGLSSASMSGPTRIARLALSYVGLTALSVAFAAPLVWMVSTSFKTKAGSVDWPPRWIPEEFSLAGYSAILNPATDTPVLRWVFNSMVAATAQTFLVLLTASTAAYALARMNFRGKSVVFAVIVSTLLIPQFVFLIGNYLIADALGWLDTLLAVIVPGAAGAFGVFFLRQFFLSLPEELEEAALIDGANRFQIFTRVVLPLSRAPLATLAVLSFLTNWNDFLWPVYVLFNPQNLTLPAGLAAMQGAESLNYPIIMAGAVLASAPVLIIYLFAQRYIIEGVSRSGLKG